jgi:glycine hydroxymethyltransferase
LILANDEELGRRINAAVFPALQGGPLMHVIAAKAVALREALQPEFRRYAGAVVENAKVLAATLVEAGLEIVSGGTDTHLMLVDLRPLGVTGRDAETSLERAGITCNKNGIPFDPQKPTVPSGIRLGSPAATTRGFGPEEFRTVGRHIVKVLRAIGQRPAGSAAIEARVRDEVRELCTRFPIYTEPGDRARPR